MRKILKRNAAGLMILLVLAVFLVPAVYAQLAAAGNEPPSESATLPTVGTYDNLLSLLENARQNQPYSLRGGMFDMAVSAKTKSAAAPTAATEQAAAEGDYSQTNTQVAGVDEADIIKTDGEYIYQVNKNRVIITRAVPAENMQVVSTITFPEQEVRTREIYVDGRRLVVIGATNNYVLYKTKGPVDQIHPPRPMSETTKILVYDIENKSSVKKLREVEVDGRYESSRKIGSALYLVNNKRLYHPAQRQGLELRPGYRDTALGQETKYIDYPDIRYFPDFSEANYLLTVGLDLADNTRPAQVAAYLGSSQNIYASTENLYAAVRKYTPAPVIPLIKDSAVQSSQVPPPAEQTATHIYKFSLNQGVVTYQAKGEVPGTILNQFSMDESKDHFRIATTGGNPGTDTSKNNVYVLDEGMKVIGKIEDIAPGEKIYSTRFMGDRAYMVTFKTVDPLFVIDLKTPTEPKILGALKIPGYSDYLHPYDENHLIGFGKDAIELAGPDGQTRAFYQGLKIALFDVTDVSHPVELFKENIGDRGTDSELLRNHKALLFSKDKNLLAFPVTLMTIKGSNPTQSRYIPEYGTFEYQGVYVYNLDLNNGFQLKGRITHLADEDYLKAGHYWPAHEKNVSRALYIGDTLYTLSESRIKANTLTNLETLSELELP